MTRLPKRLVAATLAVGTEVTDGQITDRNSTWISNRLVLAGIDVVEHRAVPDDREMIATALRELGSKVDLLFVTGGLGPTSDDFTRELVAEFFESPLEFHEPSWERIVKRFEARGATAKPIQRQQCFFPRGALVLENPAGTANAFSMPVVYDGRSVYVVTLPGPPAEIAAIWDLHLEQKIGALIPEADREDLLSWETLGPGESEVAEKVEESIKGSGLRVGYRAHLPYVEVKLWVPRSRLAELQPVIDRVEGVLATWTVVRGKDDLADRLVDIVAGGVHLTVIDRVSRGYLQTRLAERLAKAKRAQPERGMAGSLTIETVVLESSEVDVSGAGAAHGKITNASTSLRIELSEDKRAKRWRLATFAGGEPQLSLAIDASPLYNFGTERGQAYAVEKAFHLLSTLL